MNVTPLMKIIAGNHISKVECWKSKVTTVEQKLPNEIYL